MTATREERAAIARELRAAEADVVPVDQITQRWPDFGVDDAYAVQLANVAWRVEAGAVVVGHKVGLTSLAMQEMLGVDEPDYGHLLGDMMVDDGGSVSVASLCAPRAEVEIAFHLRDALRGPGCTIDDVLAATDAISPAIEIIDSRIRDWRLTLPDTVADNGSSARAVIGPARVRCSAVDLVGVEGRLLKNGHVIESGTGAAVLGHPAAAVAWLADKLSELGSGLDAGSVVLSGACARAVPVEPGDVVIGEFDGMGAVTVRFT